MPRHDHCFPDGTHMPTLELAPGAPWPAEIPSTLLTTDGGGSVAVVVAEGQVLVETAGPVALSQPEVRSLVGLLLGAWSRAGGESA